jgi:hypothetical protein
MILPAVALSACLSASAFASQPVNDFAVNSQLDKLNATAQMIDARLMLIFNQLNQSAGNGTCLLDGKAFSQGAVTQVSGRDAICSIQPKTGWPVWEHNAVTDRGTAR